MKKLLYFITAVIFLGISCNSNSASINKNIIISNMRITSQVFENNQKIPAKYTCAGDEISPPLKIENVPAGVKSLVLIADDPDAPAGTWTHWTMWNISPGAVEINEGEKPPEAIEGRSTGGGIGYEGPCPPSGTHRYFFKIYALDTLLYIPSGSELNSLKKAMEGHILDSAQIVGLYNR